MSLNASPLPPRQHGGGGGRRTKKKPPPDRGLELPECECCCRPWARCQGSLFRAENVFATLMTLCYCVLYVMEPVLITAGVLHQDTRATLDNDAKAYHALRSVRDMFWAITRQSHNSIKDDPGGYAFYIFVIYAITIITAFIIFPVLVMRQKNWSVCLSSLALLLASICINTIFRVPLPFEFVRYENAGAQALLGVVSNPAHVIFSPRIGLILIQWYAFLCTTPLRFTPNMISMRCIVEHTLFFIIPFTLPSVYASVTHQLYGHALCFSWTIAMAIFLVVHRSLDVATLIKSMIINCAGSERHTPFDDETDEVIMDTLEEDHDLERRRRNGDLRKTHVIGNDDYDSDEVVENIARGVSESGNHGDLEEVVFKSTDNQQ